jgi:hypothetical protein
LAGSQSWEQQSLSCAHDCPIVMHSCVEQTPPKQPSEQQSCAFAHATPFARHASRHWMTPAWPVTGSQRPLQQSVPVLHDCVGPRQAALAVPPPSPLLPNALPTHALALPVPEQQSKPLMHAPPAALHAFGPPPSGDAEPPHTEPVHADTQQSPAAAQAEPTVLQLAPPSPNAEGSFAPVSLAPPPSSAGGTTASLEPQLAATGTNAPSSASHGIAFQDGFVMRLQCA